MATTKSKSTKSRTSKVTKVTKSAKPNENQSNLEVVVVTFGDRPTEYSYLAMREWGIKAGDTAIVQTPYNDRARVEVVRVTPYTPNTRATKVVIGREFVPNNVAGAGVIIREMCEHINRVTKDHCLSKTWVMTFIQNLLSK